MKSVLIIQARMTSARLPGKVLLPLADQPILARVIERARRIPGLDGICVAVPDGVAHEPVAALAKSLNNVLVVRGPEDDVLARFSNALDVLAADAIMRITSDCPLLDPQVSGAVLAAFRAGGVAYVRTAFSSGYPHGLDTEVMAVAALREAAAEADDPYEREHVTPFVWRRPERFAARYVDAQPDRHDWRLAVDTQEDYDFVRGIFETLYARDPMFGLDDVVGLIESRADLLAHVVRGSRDSRPRIMETGGGHV